jgi:hypothetical protein
MKLYLLIDEMYLGFKFYNTIGILDHNGDFFKFQSIHLFKEV